MEMDLSKATQNVINVCVQSQGNAEYHDILKASLARMKQEFETIFALKAENDSLKAEIAALKEGK